jgi:hypothetical protein
MERLALVTLVSVVQLAVVAIVLAIPVLMIFGGPRLVSRTYRGVLRGGGGLLAYLVRVFCLFVFNTVSLLARLATSGGRPERIGEALARYAEQMGEALVVRASGR